MHPTTSTARHLGRATRWLTQREARFIQWASLRGVPQPLGRFSLWAMKAAVLVVLCFAAFWLVVAVVLMLAFAKAVAHAKFADAHESRWEDGLSGYGLYRGGSRVDPGSPDDHY